MAQGPIGVGEAVATHAGSLKARYVIHAAVMGQDLHTNAELIRRGTASSLALAEEMRLASLSFPALGTGVGGFSIFHCAKIMLTEASRFLIVSRYLRSVRFVLLEKEIYEVFDQELRSEFSAKRC